MKTRGLLIAASLHAGAIALACSIVSIQAGVAALPVTTQAEVSETVTAAGEVAPETTEFIEAEPIARPDHDADPALLDAGDAMPMFAPEPEPVLPKPLATRADADSTTPRHEARPILIRPAPNAEPRKPIQPVAGGPVKAKEVVSRPVVWHAPRLLKWAAPEDVSDSFEGRILAVIALDENGMVKGVTLEKGTGKPALDKLLLQSFFIGQYKPATRNGTPVASELRQPVDFE
ncbi:MAG: energy transducer TonB [Planctomycetes bacterium]|nr:energy transducer TonB [Planctomycetota bacterium]